MDDHKFRVSQHVHFVPRGAGRFGSAGAYEVVRLMPESGGAHQYRIKSTVDGQERIALESELA
jgi:hypothetical protein